MPYRTRNIQAMICFSCSRSYQNHCCAVCVSKRLVFPPASYQQYHFLSAPLRALRMTGFRSGVFGFFLQRSRQNLVPSMVDFKKMKAKFKAVLKCSSNTHSQQKQTDKCSVTCILIFALILKLIVQTALMSLLHGQLAFVTVKGKTVTNRKLFEWEKSTDNEWSRVWIVWLTICRADFERTCKLFKRSRSSVSTEE